MARELGRWFRFYDAVLDDPKVQRLSDQLFRAWVNLMCLANRNGGVIASDFASIAFSLRVSEGKARDMVQALMSANLIDASETDYAPHNWGERQFKSDVSTERVGRFRERQRNVSRNVSPPLHETAPETDTEADTKQNRKKSRGADAPPTHSVADGLGSDDAAAVANYWNNIAEEHGLSAVRRMTDARRKKINARLSEAGGLRKVAEVIDAIPAQPFLLGRNDRQWKVDFDWLLEPSNFVKVEERKYANGHA